MDAPQQLVGAWSGGFTDLARYAHDLP